MRSSNNLLIKFLVFVQIPTKIVNDLNEALYYYAVIKDAQNKTYP